MNGPGKSPSASSAGQTSPDQARQAASDGPTSPEQPPLERRLFGKAFTEKEQKRLFLYLVIGIVLLEMAITVGALVYSITNAVRVPGGMPRFNFPWLGYLVSVVLAPALVMLVIHLLSLGFTRTLEGDAGPASGSGGEAVSGRAGAFFALVRGAPTVILFAGFVLMGAAIYYLDGVMALLLKLGDSFQTVAVWLVGAFAAAWTASTIVRMFLTYKARQMEAEYAFRREVLERTGMVILDTKYAPTTELRMLPPHDGVTAAPAAALTVETGVLPPGGPDETTNETLHAVHELSEAPRTGA